MSTQLMGSLQIDLTALPRLIPRPVEPAQPLPGTTVAMQEAPVLIVPVVRNNRVRNQRKPVLPGKRLKLGTTRVKSVADENKDATGERSKKVAVCWPKPDEVVENGVVSPTQRSHNSALHEMPWIQDHKFKCGICNKLYNSKQVLKRHLNMHRGIYSYTCAICGKGYTSRSNLRGHVASQHTKVKEFKCSFCGTEFTTKYWLKDHVKMKHDTTLEQMEKMYTSNDITVSTA